MDSCDHVHTSLQALLSFLSHSKNSMSELKQMEETQKRLDMPTDRGIISKGVKTKGKKRKKRMLSTVKNTDIEISRAKPYCFDKNGHYIKENVTEERTDRSTKSQTLPRCLVDSPVPAVIGLASSSPTRAIAQTLGPFNLPLVRKEKKAEHVQYFIFTSALCFCSCCYLFYFILFFFNLS